MSRLNLVNNTSQRTPCILVLDDSYSMGFIDRSTKKSRIELLNDGLEAFYEALNEDEMALSRVTICAINAGGPTANPEIMMDWTDASDFQPFRLKADHGTPLGAATQLALDAIEEHKSDLKSSGVSYTKPWLFILTDGEPTDTEDWEVATDLARKAEAADKVEIWPIGIGDDADLETLEEISVKPPKKMSGVHFRELFVWLSASLGQVSRSVPGEKAKLPSTDPWAEVSL